MKDLKNIDRLRLVVVYNPHNKEDLRNIGIELDYTLRISLENFRKAYLKDILTRVRFYNEKIVVIINGKEPKTPYDVFDNIYSYTATTLVREIIEESDLAYYDGLVIKDTFSVIQK